MKSGAGTAIFYQEGPETSLMLLSVSKISIVAIIYMLKVLIYKTIFP